VSKLARDSSRRSLLYSQGDATGCPGLDVYEIRGRGRGDGVFARLLSCSGGTSIDGRDELGDILLGVDLAIAARGVAVSEGNAGNALLGAWSLSDSLGGVRSLSRARSCRDGIFTVAGYRSNEGLVDPESCEPCLDIGGVTGAAQMV